jgi:DnaK suppressor protein
MTAEQLEDIREIIVEKIAELEGNLAAMEESVQPISPDNAIGRVSRMDAINNKAVSEVGVANAQDTLQRLRYALRRTEQDDFGLCFKCRETISMVRLVQMPHATRCVNCAE